MIFIKKMCVLRQIKAGFTGDGRQAGGVVKVEQYGKNLAAEVSVIGFAPLSAGEYYCLLADEENRTELLPLRGKSLFNVVSDLNVENGFCAIVCLVKNGITPLAYGVSGNGRYDFDVLLRRVDEEKSGVSPQIAATKPPLSQNTAPTQTDEEKREEEAVTAPKGVFPTSLNAYDDETIAENDYYSENGREEAHAREKTVERDENARVTNPNEGESQDARTPLRENDDAQSVRRAFDETDEQYYRSVKDEIDEMFAKYPADDTLSAAFPASKWAKVQENGKREYLIGVVYENAAPLYLCYAFPAKDRDAPPEEIAEICAFVPLSPFDDSEGCFVLFQSPVTGECVKLTEA